MFDEEPDGDPHGECAVEIKRLTELSEKLEKFARWLICNRACVCNEPGHRCGTNLMLEDLQAIVGPERCGCCGEELPHPLGHDCT